MLIGMSSYIKYEEAAYVESVVHSSSRGGVETLVSCYLTLGF